MHLPSESLHGAICPVTAIMAIVGVSVAAFLLNKDSHRPSYKEFILTTVAVLALQAVNYPLPGGFSGHMLGAALAVSLLGLPAGILSMTSVITLQCLFFADGGQLQLGANVLNMAIVASLTGALLQGRQHSLPRIFAASALSVLTAVMAIAIELLLDGRSEAALMIQPLVLYHLPIALIEGAITTAILVVLQSEPLRADARRSWAIAALAVIAIAILPFASSAPDALETVLLMN